MCLAQLRAGTRLKCVLARAIWAEVLAMAFMLCAAAAHAQSFSTPANLSNDGQGTLPQITADTGGNIDIAYADRTGTNTVGGVRFVRSSDGGKTFSKPVDVASSDASYFSMALESACTIDIAYFQSGDIFFSQSNDCGKTFTPTNVTNSNGTVGSIQSIQLAAKQGAPQIAWAGSDLKIYYTSRNSNGSFAPAVVLFTQPGGAIGLSAMALSNGTTDMVWTAGEFNCQLYFLNSFAGAQPTAILPAAEDLCGTVPFAVDTAGNVNMVWRDNDLNGSHVIRFVRSNGQTGNFGAPQSIADGSQPQIAAGPGGKISLAWASGLNIVFSASNDGKTFSGPVNVTTAPSGALVSAPQVALSGSSPVDVAWVQGPNSGQSSDLWFSQSSDGGSTFSSPVDITNNQSSPSGVQMITDAGGDVLMAWSANAGNGHDIFFARSTAAGASGFTITATPATVTGLPGGTATAQFTLTPTGEFGQVVTLSCTKLPPGAACLFNPPAVTLTSSSTVGTVTISIPPTLSVGGFPFTLNAQSPTVSQFQPMQISVGVLVGSVTPRAMTIPAGGSATFAVTVASTSFGGQFSLACNAPASVKCTFTPNSTFLPVDGRVTSTLTVQVLSTPATGSAPKNPTDVFPPLPPLAQELLPICGWMLLLLSVLGFGFLRGNWRGGFGFARKFASVFCGIGLTVALAAVMVSCSGGVDKTKLLGSGSGTVGTGGTSGISGTGGTGGMGGTGGSAGAGGTTTGGVTTPGSTSVTFPLGVVAQAGGSVVNVGTVTVTVP
jgi:hypothetical protein